MHASSAPRAHHEIESPRVDVALAALAGAGLGRNPNGPPLFVAEIASEHIEARVAAWRASHSGFDAILREGAPVEQGLRRLALTHWTHGNPRLASLILSTAAAVAPEAAEIWLDLGFTLQAIGDREHARSAFAEAVWLASDNANAWLALGVVDNELGAKAQAEAAFRAALERQPALAEAAFGIALICFEQRRYVEAAQRFRAAVIGGCANPMALAGLGQSLFFLGNFADAAQALGLHIAAAAVDPKVQKRFALSVYLARLIDANLDAAEAGYIAAAGAHADSLGEVAKSAFHILSGYGHRETALALARARLSSDNDPIQRYLTDAVAGEKRDRAPTDYLVAYFDRFAEDFDRQLVEILGYRAPQDLAAMVDALGPTGPRALDLGCGTGLAGPWLRAGRMRVVGVDLAPRMLDKARQRGVYDELVEAEMMDYIASVEERFDLVLVADTLVYLGDLSPFFRLAAAIIEPGGLLAFNIETIEDAPWRLLSSGRFAHQLEATIQLAAPEFEVVARRHVQLRIEANSRVEGDLVVMRRAGGPQRIRPAHSPRVKAISAKSRRRPSAPR